MVVSTAVIIWVTSLNVAYKNVVGKIHHSIANENNLYRLEHCPNKIGGEFHCDRISIIGVIT
jgi:hypothetical protein